MEQDVLAGKIADYFSEYQLRSYKKGKILLLNGDAAKHVHYLVEGKVKQYDISYRGDEIILNVFKPLAYFPMPLAISKNPSPYIFEAETDIKVRTAPADEVVEFVKQNQDVMFDLLTRVYRGTDGLLGRISQLSGGTANSRLLYELLIESYRFGKKQDNGQYVLTVNEKALAARAGLTVETVSREVHKLKDAGIVEVGNKKIHIKSLQKLENLLNET
jgi:CRP-like cAMP-binding protein